MNRKLRIRQEGGRVLVIESGRKILDLPWQAALDFGLGVCAQAKKAEEYDEANLIIMDNAILFRAGFPLGLTNQPALLKETVRTAQHDRDLRRYMPGGIKSESIVGTPALIQKEPVKTS